MCVAGDLAVAGGDCRVAAFCEQGGGGVFHAGASGDGQADIQGDQVQVDDGRAGCGGEAVAGRSTVDEGGAVYPLDVAGRVAAVAERVEGGYGAGGAEAAAAGVFAVVHERAGEATRGEAGYHGLGADARAERHIVEGEVRVGRVVCGPCVATGGLGGGVFDNKESVRPGRDIAGWTGDDGGF